MHKSKSKLYELIKDLKTKDEFEKEIKKRSKEIDKLLDEDTIAFLIVDELGRNNQVIKKISDLKPDSEYTIIGKVKNIFELRKFKRKNGKSGKVLNLDICDETGTCRLVLWDNDVEIVKNNEIVPGMSLKIINGYTRKGYSGIEINLGRWGLLEIIKDENINFKDNIKEIKGKLIHRDPTKVFFKDSGDVGFVTFIKLQDNDEEKQITLWDAKVKEIQKIKIGTNLLIEDITVKNYKGIEEIHANGNSKINIC